MRNLLYLLLFLSVLGFIPGCAGKTAPTSGSQKQWILTNNAKSVYSYLLYEDARYSGNKEQAEKALNNLLQADPTPAVFQEAANYYWQVNKIPSAREILKQGLSLYPENQDLILLLTQTYLTEKRYHDAALTLREYVEKNPENTPLRLELADILIQSEQFTEALDVIKEIPKEEFTPSVLYYKAKAQAGLGFRNKAISLLKKALEEDPEFIRAWAELAYLYELEKDYVAAEKTYTSILKLGETSQELWLRLIDINLKLNSPETALGMANRGPDDIDFKLEVGTLFLDHKFYDYAEEVLLPLLDEPYVPPRVYFYVALLEYEGRDNIQGALQYLEQVPESASHYQRALMFRIQLLKEAGNTQQALDMVREARTNMPNNKDFWVMEAGLLEDLEQYQEALELLSLAQDKWPDDPEIMYQIGMILENRGRHEEALEHMESIITAHPDFPDALNFVGYMLADQQRDLDRAMVLIRTALEHKPDSGYIIDSLAWVHYSQGNIQAAWEEIQRAVDKVDTDPVIWEHYGDIASALGKLSKAIEAYKKALDLGHDNPESLRKKMNTL